MSANASDPNEEALFEKAIAIPSREARAAFLMGACGDDADLRTRVERLLAAHEKAGGFMKTQQREDSMQPTLLGTPLAEGPGTVIGRYKLLQKIGEGGMGVVYMAEQTEPVIRKVALKIIKLGMDTRQVVARFEAERQALAMMDHPNIARVLDGGSTELSLGVPPSGGPDRLKPELQTIPSGRPYFVMELVQGVPITEFCDKNKLTAKERLELFIPVCQAIQSAHQKGVIHRDIKPSNVLVTLLHGEPIAKVIDFGIAKATNQKLTEKTLFTNFATMIGTPAYMSPEQAEMSAMDVDTRTDIYSLGVLLYELLTGTTPFPEKRLRSAGYGEMQRIIAEEEPEKPSTRLSKTLAAGFESSGADKSQIANRKSKIDPDLDWITMKCLEKDRRRRYETPNELAADLKRHLNDEPVSAAAPTLSYQLHKLYAKNKGLVRTVAVISFTLTAATVVSGYLATRMNRLRIEANGLRESESVLRMEAETGRDRAESAEKETTERSIELENHLYVSDMLAVGQAVANKEWKVARDLLERHRKEPSGNDLRGFEWRYYWQESKGEFTRAFKAHEGAINQMAISSDRRWLATASEDGKTKLWDLNSDRLIHEWNTHSNVAFSVSFSHDNRFLTTAGYSGGEAVGSLKACIWNLTSKELAWSPPDEWAYAVMSPSQPIVALGMGGNERGFEASEPRIELWDYERRAPVDPPANIPRDLMVFSPSGEYLAVAGPVVYGSAKIQIQRISTREVVADIPDGWAVRSLSFSADEKYLASASTRDISIWETATGKKAAVLRGHDRRVNWALFHPNQNETIVSCSVDQTVRVWNWKENRTVRVFSSQGSEVTGLAIDPNGDSIVTGGKDGSVMYWNLESAPTPTVNQITNVITISDPIISRAGKFMVLTEWSGPPDTMRQGLSVDPFRIPPSRRFRRLIDPATLEALKAAAPPPPPGQSMIKPTNYWREVVYNVSNGSRLWQISDDERALGFSPEETMLITAATNQVSYRNASNGALVRTLTLNPPITNANFYSRGPYHWCDLSPDGKRMAAVGDDEAIRLIDLSTGETTAALEKWMPIVNEPISVTRLRFSPSGDKIVYTGKLETGVWDLNTGETISLSGDNGWEVQGFDFSPDGNVVAGACGDNTVRIWNLQTGELVHSIKGFREGLLGVAYSPDGRTLAVYRLAPAVTFWNTRTWRQVGEFKLASFTRAAVFSPDGRFLATGGFGDGVRLWRAPLFEEIEETQRMNPSP